MTASPSAPAAVLLLTVLACAAALPGAAARSGAHRALLQGVTGYQFFLGRDSEKLDIRQMPAGATLAQLEAACNSEPTCVGFNTWGWIKYGIKDQKFWNNETQRGATAGLYVKDGLVPGSLHPILPPGYTFTHNKDSSNGDIREVTAIGSSPAVLAQLCDAEPTCVGFNARGWLKANIL
ncbi:MAG: hypothetical protein J3K34DRAFT_425449 [Monoraphidium minutum]|nr:MAG: hypothetical protein J3K34DRAFT_425449 [Monoraphidium minutum]